MSPINNEIENIIRDLTAGLKSMGSPGVDPDSIQIKRDPSIFSGEINFTIRNHKWSIGFCLHPHDYPNNFVINGRSDPELPLNNDSEIAQSVKKIVARVISIEDMKA